MCIPSNFILNDEHTLALLLERIDKLEAADRANKLEMASLQTGMEIMESRFLEKERNLLSEIEDLKSKLLDNDVDHNLIEVKQDSDAHVSDKKPESPRNNTRISKHPVHRREVRRGRKLTNIRDAVETEVAFYSTHSQHDITHLGQNQILVFDQAVTNVGNAYNSHHGGFVAPVSGTYVFHVTMMGRDVHAVTSNHFSAYVDVDGKSYSQLWVAPYEQSSQMLVIELSAGQTVTVRNHFQNDSFVGQHMSTFSGFLLYQHYSSPAIVGK